MRNASRSHRQVKRSTRTDQVVRPGPRPLRESLAPRAGVIAFGAIAVLVLALRYQPAISEAMAPAVLVQKPGPVNAGSTAGKKPVKGTVLGRVVTTDFGDIQVQLTVRKGKIITASAVKVPHDSGAQGQRINARAVPILNTETKRGQSANIDTVSGATISSIGYKKSLQSAIDNARL